MQVSLSVGHFPSLLGCADAQFNEFVSLKDQIACVLFPGKDVARTPMLHVLGARVVSQLAARLHTLCLLVCSLTHFLIHNLGREF